MLNQNPEIFVELYQNQLRLYFLVKSFPKSYKYTLGEDVLKLGWATLDAALEANSKLNNQKAPYILATSLRFDKLKYRLRAAFDLKLISVKDQAKITEYNAVIGKMLNGWLIWSKSFV